VYAHVSGRGNGPVFVSPEACVGTEECSIVSSAVGVSGGRDVVCVLLPLAHRSRLGDWLSSRVAGGEDSCLGLENYFRHKIVYPCVCGCGHFGCCLVH
jgi:hypothetical protein